MENDIVNTEERSEQAELLKAIRELGRVPNDADLLVTLKDIVENGARRYRGCLVDSYSASAFLTVYDRVNDVNQGKLLTIAATSLPRAFDICFKTIRKSNERTTASK